MLSDIVSTLPRRQLGRYLLEWRGRAGLTQTKAAQLLEMGSSSLQRLESGQNSRIKSRDIRAACELYGMPDDLTSAMVGLAQQAAVKNWWHQYGDVIPKDFDVYVGLEAAADSMSTYQPDLIPGLLQIADYDRVRAQLNRPDATGVEIDQRVDIRMRRQRIVTRKSQPLVIDTVIGESALWRVAGNHKIMAAQLRHLADLSLRDNITIRVLPFEAGFPDGLSMQPFVLLSFGQGPTGQPIEPPVVYLEGAVGDMYLEKAEDVESYHRSYCGIRRAAMDTVGSRDLLRRIAREHERREH